MDPDVCPTDRSASAPIDLCFAAAPVNGAPEVPFSAQTVSALPQAEDIESYNPIEPPPLDWRSDSSSDAGSADDLDDPSYHPSVENLEVNITEPVFQTLNLNDTLHDTVQQEVLGNIPGFGQDLKTGLDEVGEAAGEVQRVRAGCLGGVGEYQYQEYQEEVTVGDLTSMVSEKEDESANRQPGDEDHSSIHSLLSQLQLMGEESDPIEALPPHFAQHQQPCLSELDTCTPSLLTDDSTETTGLLFSESHHRDLLGLLQFTELSSTPHSTHSPLRGEMDAVVSVSYSQEDAQRFWRHHGNGQQQQQHQHQDLVASLSDDEYPEPVWKKRGEEPPKEEEAAADTEQVGWTTVVVNQTNFVFWHLF